MFNVICSIIKIFFNKRVLKEKISKLNLFESVNNCVKVVIKSNNICPEHGTEKREIDKLE